ncbi:MULTISPECIES: TetR/AcrR family transcriptional regulator [unclassified Streptomyces]|uniref:TetR/AcrR family transcriptional regulator n=1 Tax=unclassified Streptomyces TaxID=2593676 RepID=UPI001F04E6C8|nr:MULTISPECIES: TetR/AcrR family transcriptional regulator [unclassified Streptomyces]MCH0566134.1 WHG domain-containing protein [Streptomyces sp. MUM 2J]MCH0572335.1 WHG domain-containing protein [Streptomyces sp. MUM 136J]
MVPMPASRPYHHGDLRAALLKSAERTLRDKGAAALSLRELARDIGVSHAAPGRHFKDKQALLDALALAGYERLLRDLAAADATDRPIDERMGALARTYLGFAIDNPALLELMFARKHEPDSSDRLAAAVEESFDSLTRIVADAQARGEIVAGDPERIMMVIAAGMHGLAALVAGCALTPEEALAGLDEQVHHLLYGLRPR